MIDIVDRLQNNHRDLHGDDYTIAMFADRKEAAALIISLRGEIERLRETIRQNCNGDVVALANPNSAMELEVYKRAADESEQRRLVKELREDVAEDGKTIETLRTRVAELEKALNPFAAIADRAEEMGFKADISVLYVTLGPCRRARTVLDAGREKE